MYYIGITIGPIFDTILEAKKPIGLWFASSLFSDITKRLCKEIQEKCDVTIISPYYKAIDKQDGIGKYHDRIIFSTQKYEEKTLVGIINKVKQETVGRISGLSNDEKFFLKHYIQIQYVVLPKEKMGQNDTAILALSPYLDAIELMKKPMQNQVHNPFFRILNDKDSNNIVKATKIFDEIEEKEKGKFQNKNGSIRNIEDIANSEKESNKKSQNYFAVVSADGDGLGKLLKELIQDEDITGFSKACFAYDQEAAEKVNAFGGMTIYAGGDDLLFLAPVTNNEKTIFDVCQEINNLFQEKMKQAFKGNEKALKNVPTISFGIAIHYYKYPLYEALEHARKLLYFVKSNTDKNAMAINVEKHSGQRMGIVIPNNKYQNLTEILKSSKGEKEVHSAIYTLEKIHTFLTVIDEKDLSKEEYWQRWKNFFDNEGQKGDAEYHEMLSNDYYDYFRNKKLGLQTMEEDDSSFKAFTTLLRINKFLQEEGK